MGRKQKHEEHVNLERYLVSYADFITLLFATFVVLYALSQVDISAFSKLEESLKHAFSTPSIIDGNKGIMDGKGESLIENSGANSIISALMMEYLSPKYENEAYEAIRSDIEDLIKNKELDGVSVELEDKGLVIKITDTDIIFESASAKLQHSSKLKLDKIGLVIAKRFLMHAIRIEGNTDSLPFSNEYFPSNWELSSARACTITRYLIDRFRFKPDLFTAIGYGDTRPIADNATEEGRRKNRRVEIVILRNRFKNTESAQNSIIKMSQQEQEAYRLEHIRAINKVKGLSDAALQLTGNDEESAKNVLILNEIYTSETRRINSARKTNSLIDVNNVDSSNSKKNY